MTLVCLLAISLSGHLPFQPGVHVEHKPYHGWKDAYWISNDTAELVVVPAIGRVVRYAELSQPNLLWENASVASSPGTSQINWLNYGGDKEWVAPQSLTTWPPDPQVDPGPYQFQLLPNGIVLTGPVSAKLKVRVTRQIVLADSGSKVSFTNTVQNLGQARRLCPWQVTQIDDPQLVILPHRMTGTQQSGYYNYGQTPPDPAFFEIKGDEIHLKRNPQLSRKYGAHGLKGEITAQKGVTIFHTIQDVTRSGVYPDQNSPQQVYLSADPLAYVELEQVGPLVRLETNEVAIQHVQWFLTSRIR